MSSRSAPIVAQRMENPFKMGQRSQLFGFKDAQIMKERKARLTLLSMSLVERNSQLRSKIPPLRSQSSISKITSTTTERSESELGAYIRRVKEKQDRCMRLTEFVRQKREIYQTQLLIDSKKTEVDKVKKEILQTEKVFNDDEALIFETAQKYKILTAKIEDELSKGRKKMEVAIAERVDMQKKMKKQKLAIEIIQSELSKNEDLLEHFQTYGEFVSKFENEQLITNPNNLIKEFYDMEQENLFLIRECEFFSDAINSEKKDTEILMKKANQSLDKLNEIIKKRPATQEVVVHQPLSTDVVDSELKNISQLITKTYDHCFHVKADIAPIAMMERIENSLEFLYKKIEEVDNHFMLTKQNKYDRDRREESRIALQAQKERIQQEKKDAAVERARKPIKKNFGRPLVERSIPVHFKRQNNEKMLKQILEQQEMERALFGEILE